MEHFDEAWHEDLIQGMHGEHGPYVLSSGFTEDGRLLEMVWRWHREDLEEVWPVTAYFPEEDLCPPERSSKTPARRPRGRRTRRR